MGSLSPEPGLPVYLTIIVVPSLTSVPAPWPISDRQAGLISTSLTSGGQILLQGIGPHVSSPEQQGGPPGDRMHTVIVRLVPSEGQCGAMHSSTEG